MIASQPAGPTRRPATTSTGATTNARSLRSADPILIFTMFSFGAEFHTSHRRSRTQKGYHPGYVTTVTAFGRQAAQPRSLGVRASGPASPHNLHTRLKRLADRGTSLGGTWSQPVTTSPQVRRTSCAGIHALQPQSPPALSAPCSWPPRVSPRTARPEAQEPAGSSKRPRRLARGTGAQLRDRDGTHQQDRVGTGDHQRLRIHRA